MTRSAHKPDPPSFPTDLEPVDRGAKAIANYSGGGRGAPATAEGARCGSERARHPQCAAHSPYRGALGALREDQDPEIDACQRGVAVRGADSKQAPASLEGGRAEAGTWRFQGSGASWVARPGARRPRGLGTPGRGVLLWQEKAVVGCLAHGGRLLERIPADDFMSTHRFSA